MRADTRGLSILCSALMLAACAGSGAAGSGRSAIVSLRDISCQSCGAAAVRALKRRDGVYQARFDRDKVEVALTYDPRRVSPAALIQTVSALGYQAALGGGKGFYSPEVKFPDDVDMKWISKAGEGVDIAAHRVADKVTVFDFSAVWCGPCRKVDRQMLAILKTHDDVALRKLNVVDWSSAIAKRYLKNVRALPYVVVYDKRGRKVVAISGLDLDRLRSAIAKARR